MTLALVQKGTRAGLVVWCTPMPANPDGSEGAPGLSKECRAALGPAPTIVGVNAHGAESMDEILAFAHLRTGIPRFSLSSLAAFSAGCQNVRRWAIAGAPSLSYVLCDGMHCAFPEPTAEQAEYMRALAEGARAGKWTAAISHSYIVTEPKYTSTRAAAELATGWPAPEEPPQNEGQRRDEGGLHVLSVGGADQAAHQFQAAKVLPRMLADYVRPIVDAAPEIEGSPGPPGEPVVTPGEPLPIEPPPAPLEPATPAPAALAALRDMDARWPGRDKSADGIIGDAAHQARESAHNQGNAVDITHDPRAGASGDIIAPLALEDSRSVRVIWNRQVHSKDARGWHPYTGANPHINHVHVEIAVGERADDRAWGWAPGRTLEPIAVHPGAIFTSAGWLDLELDYLPRVVTAEIGDVEPAAMLAQAICARTYLARARRDEPTLGTPAKPVPNSQNFQVFAPEPTAKARSIVAQCPGVVVTWRGALTICNYVAGAIWTPTGPGPLDASKTEHFVTYNEGRSGDAVRKTTLASPRPDNRGCLSQEGAKALAKVRGYDAPAILRFFYGADLEVSVLGAPGGPSSPAELEAPSSPGPGLLPLAFLALRMLSSGKGIL